MHRINQQLIKKKLFARIGTAVLVLFMVCSVGLGWVQDASAVSAEGSSKINAVVHDSLSVGVASDGVAFSITPTPAGHFDSKKTQVHVYTNSDGYKLYMWSKTTNADLTQAGVSTPISNLTSPVTIDNLGTEFPINSWGFSLDNTNYSPISTDTATPNLLKTQTGYLTQTAEHRGGEDIVDLYFGAKVTTAMQSGTYSNTVVITAEATVVTPNAPTISGETGWVNSATIRATTPGTSKYDVKEYEFFVTQDNTIDPNSTDVTVSGHGEELTINHDTGYADGIYYVFFRAVDYNGQKSIWSNQVQVKLDGTAPTIQFATTNATGAATQTATLKCADNVEVQKYLWNKDENAEPTATTPATDFNDTKTVNAAGKYTFYCMDEAGNKSEVKTQDYFTYSTVTLLDTTDGTSGNYIRANYASYKNGDNFLAPAGTMIQPTDFYTVPTPESKEANYKGASIVFDVTNPAVLTKTPLELTKDTTFYAWFDRDTFTLKLNRQAGIANVEGDGIHKYGEAVHIKTTMADGFNWKKWTVVSGNTPANTSDRETTVVITKNTELTAESGDGQTPIVQSIKRKTGTNNVLQFTITDNVAVQKYCATSADGKPADTDACWKNANNSTSFSGEFSITGAGTWSVWGMDDTGNISTSAKSMIAYEVERSVSGGALTTAWESSTGTTFSNAKTFALAGTPIYVSATTINGYNSFTLKWYDGDTATTISSPTTRTVIAKTKIEVVGNDTENPVVTTISRATYDSFDFTITDNVGVANWCVTDSNSSDGCSWQAANGAKSFSGSKTGIASAKTWYVWGQDAAGHVTELADSKSITSYKVTRSVTNATLTTKWESSTGTAFSAATTYALNDTPIYVEASPANGYTTVTLTFAGVSISSGSVNNVTKDTEIKATSSDGTSPTTSVSTTQTAGATKQTATLTCTDDGTGVDKYYWGTNQSPADTDFASVSGGPKATFTTTTDVSAAGTYYLFCKDAAGNKNTNKDTTNTLNYYTYQVKSVLNTVSGTAGTYTNANYAESGNNSSVFIAPKNLSVQPGDYKQIPTGSVAGNYKGWSAAFNTTAQTLKTTTQSITANTTFYAWYDRSTYTVSLSKGTGISSVSGAGTYKYGASVNIDATVSSGYTWVNWTGTATKTDKAFSISSITSNHTYTANATDSTNPVATIVSAGADAGKTSQTVSLKCEDAGTKVKKWYFGTTQSPADSAFTTLSTATATWTKTDASVSAAGTYYLICKDEAGNTSNKPSVVYYTYQVQSVLNTVAGTAGTYNSSNYAASGNNSSVFVIKSGTSVQPGDAKQVPTGSAAGNYKGWSTAFNTTAQTLKTVTQTISANTTFYAWFDRNSYTVTLNKGTGISSVSGAGTYKHGATVNIDATVSNGYTWVNWTKSAGNDPASASTKATNIASLTANTTLQANASDQTAPECSISTTNTVGKTSQTATLKCTDGVGVTKYYWGTKSSPADSDYSAVTSTTSLETTKSVTAAGTYYLFAKDAAGKTSTSKSQIYYTYQVKSVLNTVAGTAGTYTSSNYAESGNNSSTFVVPSGTSVQPGDAKQVPTGSAAGNYKGWSTAFNTTAQTLKTTTQSITANTTFYAWFDRSTYTITLTKGTGISAISGNGTFKYGASTTLGATVSSGYTWSKWTQTSGGADYSTTQGATISNITQNYTLTANAVDSTDPVATIVRAGADAGKTSQTISLKCEDAGTKVKKWYFGTTQSPADSAFTTLATATATWTKTDASVSAAGTYYLICKDEGGRTSNKPSVTYYTYQVKSVLNTVAGTAGTYNSSNYAESGNNSSTFVIKSGTSVQPGDAKQVPTGSAAGNYKGWSTAFNTTAQTLKTTTQSITANTTFYAWFDRNTYTVTLNKSTGISSVSGAGTYKYGATASIDATVSSGYTWSAWKNGSNNWSTTKSTSISNITANWTLSANATDSTGPKVTAIGRSAYNTVTFTLTDAGSGIASYCITSGNQPAASSCTTTTGLTSGAKSFDGSITIPTSSAQTTWKIWGVDKDGNVTATGDTKSITSYKITRNQGGGSTLNTCFDQTSACTSSTTGYFTTSPIYVLAGTKIYVAASGSGGYSLQTLTYGGSNMANNSYKEVDAAAEIKTTAADTTAPAVTAATRKTGAGNYNKFDFTITDGVGVTAYCVNTSSTQPAANDGCWTTVSSTTSYSGTATVSASTTYYVWGKDAAGNRTTAANSKSIRAYKVTKTATATTINTYANVSSANTSYAVTDSTFYVTASTPMYISATPTNQSANITTFTLNGTDKKSSAGGFTYTVESDVTLVAESKAADMSTATYLQDVTKAMCEATEDSSTNVYFLKDRRLNASSSGAETTSGYSYRVKKLGNDCWMTQNLALQGGTKLTTTYSNVANNDYTLPSYWVNNYTAGAVYDGNHSNNSTDQYTNNYGTFYNYCAATAGTSCDITTVDWSNTTYDVCPKNWHLPSFNGRGKTNAGSGEEFYTLVNKQLTSYNGSNGWVSTSNWGNMAYWELTNPTGFVGYYNCSGNRNLSGSYGYWWSSTTSDNGAFASFLQSGVPTSTTDAALWNRLDRKHGASVRCVVAR